VTAKVGRWVALARGPLGRWARGWLVLAGDRGDPDATDAVWDLWLEAPDPGLWAALARWRRPRTGGGLSLVALGEDADPAVVADAARRTGHPIAVTARAAILGGHQDLVDAACAVALSTQDKDLTAFCAEHHLAPAEPHQAAMFFLLTGQEEQYRVADPDHSLLAPAYEAASEDVRSRVRARVAGDPDLVRVLAGTVRRGRLARLSEREAAYLVDGFAGRRDWAGLWTLAKDLPVVDAVAAVRRCEGRRPGDHDAPLFDALAAVDPAELAESRRAAVRPVRLPVAGSFRGSITPDGRRIALSTGRAVEVYTLPDGAAPRFQERVPTSLHPWVLALDGDVLVVSNTDPQQADGFSDAGYVAPDSGPGTSGTCRFHWAAALVRTEDGFAAQVYDKKKNTSLLHLLSGGGWDFHRYGHRVLDVRAELGIVAQYRRETCTIAIDPGSGRTAVAANSGLYLAEITDDGVRPLATAPARDGMLRHLSFAGPDRLIRLAWGGKLQVWRLDGDVPRVAAERTGIADVVGLPGVGVVAAIPRPGSGVPRRVRYLDGETLADVPTPAQFYDRGEPAYLFASPDGDRLGVGYREFVEVVDAALVVLADRPLAATTPADLHAVRARLDRAPGNLFLGLLHECLVHRFGGDVALGDSRVITGRADDIALGGSA
jgi:hypothetical protein